MTQPLSSWRGKAHSCPGRVTVGAPGDGLLYRAPYVGEMPMGVHWERGAGESTETRCSGLR